MQIRHATSFDLPAITDIVERAYRIDGGFARVFLVKHLSPRRGCRSVLVVPAGR